MSGHDAKIGVVVDYDELDRNPPLHTARADHLRTHVAPQPAALATLPEQLGPIAYSLQPLYDYYQGREDRVLGHADSHDALAAQLHEHKTSMSEVDRDKARSVISPGSQI
ncbi:hypothetical protein [Nocardia heshunensis]